MKRAPCVHLWGKNDRRPEIELYIYRSTDNKCRFARSDDSPPPPDPLLLFRTMDHISDGPFSFLTFFFSSLYTLCIDIRPPTESSINHSDAMLRTDKKQNKKKSKSNYRKHNESVNYTIMRRYRTIKFVVDDFSLDFFFLLL